ncbi:Xaa-Pro aminopeptidase [Elusimicrobium simillimum]|uniref:M24 family metallopeptidase n=1 Tax=Elusimicrobium simillimum TaxID=3143438 RepID=UPI003C6EAB9A
MKNKISSFIKSIAPYTGYVTTDVADIEYFTGYPCQPTERNVMLVSKDGIVIFARAMGYHAIKESVPQANVILSETTPLESCVYYLKKAKLKHLVFDKNKETYAFGSALAIVRVVAASGVTAEVRKIKSEAEIKIMRKSCQIAYKAFEHVKPLIKTGMTELEVVSMLESYMKRAGARENAFRNIVCFGANSANAHHAADDTKLKAEDAVLMDFGCIYKGYCSDITRSWWHGKNAPAEYKKIWNIVDKAKKAGLKGIKTGMLARKADKICRDIVEAAGYGPFIHSTGHGVGMDIHEAPALSPANEDEVLKAGHVFSVEPGIYIPGKFGVRLEDTVSLTGKGVAVLTKK